MHNLEHLLFILSLRLREAGNEELADAAARLGAASHGYEPVPYAVVENPDGPTNDDEALAEMNADWSRRFLPPVTEYKKLYVIHDPGTGFLKIGHSSNPERRLNHFQTGTPQRLTIIHTHPCEDDGEAIALEAMVHRILSAHRVTGEWFNVTLDEAKAAIHQACTQRST